MEVFVIVAMALGVMIYVGYPFWSRREAEVRGRRRPGQDASGSIILELDELDLDREAGGLEADDYASLKPAAQYDLSGTGPTDDEIERRVRALRAKRVKTRDGKRSGKR